MRRTGRSRPAADAGALNGPGSDASAGWDASGRAAHARPATQPFDRAFDLVGPGIVRGPIRLFWWGIWLVFLANPISAVASGRYPDGVGVVAALSLVAFAAIYLLVGWSAFGVARRAGGAPDLRPYAALLAVTIPLVYALGGAWSEMFIYLGVATGATLDIAPALVMIAALVAGDVAGAVLGRWAWADVWFGAFMTAALGLTMISFRRVVALIVELRAARAELATVAVAEERLRFARDLHDVLGHSLSVIALKSQVARRLMVQDPPAAAAALSDLEAVTRESLGALREMVTGYRTRSLEDELMSASEVLTAAGIEVEVARPQTPLPPSTEELLGWVVREGVTNVLRHSRARSCRIVIGQGRGGVRLEIIDDGVGGPGTGSGSGLSGLRERLAKADGSLEAGPAVGGGFRLSVALPSRAAA